MRFLAVHPSCLMYSKVFLRLEPLGLELVAEAARRAGNQVRIIDLQVDNHRYFFKTITQWRPDAVAFSCNYLANVPEIIDLAKTIKAVHPNCFVFIGGHSASFTAHDFLYHGAGAIDCVLTGEGEASVVDLLMAVQEGQGSLLHIPGVVTASGTGPPPVFVDNLDTLQPARDLLRKRNKYFIGVLDPCASIEFSRGCPWDCAFCSAWTFYGRSYRVKSPEASVAELERINEPGLFIVDDVAFVQSKHAMNIGESIARRGIKKKYYLETRGDVLLRNKDVFEFWRELGLVYIFLGVEAIDEDGLQKFRKRVSLSRNYEALEYARSLGIRVAINLIADPEWDEKQFSIIRQWCMEIPELVNISINTPYPGTETWNSGSQRLSSRDYRLFDIQHAVLPTKLPLEVFYEELVKTQSLLYRKYAGAQGKRAVVAKGLRQLARGKTSFIKMLWNFRNTYDPKRLVEDHRTDVKYEMLLPPPKPVNQQVIYIHAPRGRKSRAIDDATEQFVNASHTGE